MMICINCGEEYNICNTYHSCEEGGHRLYVECPHCPVTTMFIASFEDNEEDDVTDTEEIGAQKTEMREGYDDR